jgi:succinate dehydrogenase / fumarate reductase flavoprotein subunit
MSPEWRKIILVLSATPEGAVTLLRQPNPAMRPDLLELFDVSELKKYMTEDELAGFSVGAAVDGSEEKPPSEASEAPARKARK